MSETPGQSIAPVRAVAINGPLLHRRGQPDREPYVSVVVPIFNEVDNIEALLAELMAAMERTGRSHELICVDDGSTDGSFELLRAAHARDPRVIAVRFRRNFGQTPAIAAGFDRARGEWVTTIDAAPAQPPGRHPGGCTARGGGGHDAVSGRQVQRKDARCRPPAAVAGANWLIGRTSPGRRRTTTPARSRPITATWPSTSELYVKRAAMSRRWRRSLGIRWIRGWRSHHARARGVSKAPASPFARCRGPRRRRSIPRWRCAA